MNKNTTAGRDESHIPVSEQQSNTNVRKILSGLKFLEIERRSRHDCYYMAKQTNLLAHTKWMCKYHIVSTPKYRRKTVYNQYKTDLRDILKQLCSYKGADGRVLVVTIL